MHDTWITFKEKRAIRLLISLCNCKHGLAQCKSQGQSRQPTKQVYWLCVMSCSLWSTLLYLVMNTAYYFICAWFQQDAINRHCHQMIKHAIVHSIVCLCADALIGFSNQNVTCWLQVNWPRYISKQEDIITFTINTESYLIFHQWNSWKIKGRRQRMMLSTTNNNQIDVFAKSR